MDTETTDTDKTGTLSTKTKTILLVLGAIGCGGGAAFFTSGYIDNEITSHKKELDAVYEKVKVAVPVQDLRAGELISFNNVVIREMPKGFLHEDTIYPENMKQVAGHQLAHPVNRGAPLLMSHLSKQRGAEIATLIKTGQRAITFPVDSLSSLSGMLRPQDHIDLMMTTKDGKQDQTFTMIDNVKVMATGETVEKLYGDTEDRGYNTITIAVSKLNAGRILHARKIGRLSILLRSPGDTNHKKDKRITKNTVLGKPEKKLAKAKKRASGNSVEMIVGSVGQ